MVAHCEKHWPCSQTEVLVIMACQPVVEYPQVVAVIVTYRPELERMAPALDALREQCIALVVDNGDDPACCLAVQGLCAAKGFPLLSMEGNRGIGAAQNAGIRWARQAGASHVLLLDDDSLAPSGMVHGLMTALETLRASGCRIGSVGPRAFDPEGHDISNTRPDPSGISVTRELMSSGSLIPLEVFEAVGDLDETLFIDCVDFEWGWRAQKMGYVLCLTDSQRLSHRLGQGYLTILGLKVRYCSPIRHYYQYRNSLSLMFRDYVPGSWRFRQAVLLCLKPFVLIPFMQQRRRRLGFIWRGLRDAVLRRRGKYGE